MKRSALAILVLVIGLPAAIVAADVRFAAPTWEAPRYEIRLPFEVAKTPVTVKEVLLDGARVESFRVFRAGKLADIAKPLDKGVYEIVLDHAWASAKRYAFTVLSHGPDPAKIKESALPALSPATGGDPPGKRRGLPSRLQGRGNGRPRAHRRGRRARHHGGEGRAPGARAPPLRRDEGGPVRGPGLQGIRARRERRQDQSPRRHGQDRLPVERRAQRQDAPPCPQGQAAGRASRRPGPHRRRTGQDPDDARSRPRRSSRRAGRS